MNGFAVLEATLILVRFIICLLILLTSGLDNGCVYEIRIFRHRRLILHLLLQNSNSLAFNQPNQT